MSVTCRAEPAHLHSVKPGVDGALQVDGLSCFTHTFAATGSDEVKARQSEHVFAVGLSGKVNATVEASWDGANRTRRRISSIDYSVVIPAGQTFFATYRGASAQRYAHFHLEHSAFVNALGDSVQDFEIKAHFGERRLERGIVERFDVVCRKPDEFPPSYTEALTSMLLIELYRAHAAHPLPQQPHGGVGTARFKLVLDYIEEHLDHDIGLFGLASLAGLSVTHFAHAFKATYQVPPYRYILERRIARAKVLLCTTNETIATIAARVGFPSQSRFSQLFSRLSGMTPSNYRSTGTRARAA
jgi:AraC-like DNA-binding protein